MIQLKYVYRDIKRNYIRNVLQMMLSLIILAYSLQAAITMFDGICKVDSLRKQNCYRLADTTSESKFEELLNKPGVVKNVAKDIFNYIDLNDITYFVSWNYDNGNIDGNVVKQYTMSQNYVEYFSFDLYSGSLFKNEDYYSENEIVPIIIGNELKEKYDYVIIDCPPSLGLITLNAFTASDSVLIPVQCEYFALEAVAQILSTISKVQSKYNKNLEILGFLMTMYDARVRLATEVTSEIRGLFQEKTFNTEIPRNVSIAEAAARGKPIIFFRPSATGSQAYISLAKEILSNE